MGEGQKSLEDRKNPCPQPPTGTTPPQQLHNRAVFLTSFTRQSILNPSIQAFNPPSYFTGIKLVTKSIGDPLLWISEICTRRKSRVDPVAWGWLKHARIYLKVLGVLTSDGH